MRTVLAEDLRPSQRVRNFLVAEIHEGRLQHEDRLPTERALAESLGISRSAVREALATLESERLIKREIGRGTFVTTPDDPVVRMLMPFRLEASPAKLIEARFVIEPQIAELAVVNTTASDLTALRALCEKLSTARTAAEFETLDRSFHQAIADAARNPLLTAIYEALNAARDTPEWRKLKDHRFQSRPERRPRVLEEHRRVIDLMEERDPAGVREATLVHLRSVRENLLGF